MCDVNALHKSSGLCFWRPANTTLPLQLCWRHTHSPVLLTPGSPHPTPTVDNALTLTMLAAPAPAYTHTRTYLSCRQCCLLSQHCWVHLHC
jgi:hypothetical protein